MACLNWWNCGRNAKNLQLRRRVVVVVDPDQEDAAISALKAEGETATALGTVTIQAMCTIQARFGEENVGILISGAAQHD